MKQIIASALLILTVICANASLTAEQVMDKVAKTLTSHPSATVAFDIDVQGKSTQGTMTMCDKRFNFSAGDMALWFDGRTQWVLQRSVREVNITEPTPDELLESNPLRVLTTYRNLYDCKLLAAPKGQYKIQLTAKKKSQYIRSATVTVSSSDFKPLAVLATTSNGTANVRINSVSYGKSLPISYFTYNTKSDPTVTIVDLR